MSSKILLSILLYSTLLLSVSSRIVMKLVHIDSIHSPLHNSNTTLKERAEIELQRSKLCAIDSGMKRDLRKAKEIFQVCVEMYLGPLRPNTSHRIKLDYSQCGEVFRLVGSTIFGNGGLLPHIISEIEDVPNHDFREIKRCPGNDYCKEQPAEEEIVLSEEDRELFSSTMTNCVDLYLHPPIGVANYTSEERERSEILWCTILFANMRSCLDRHGNKVTSSYVERVKNIFQQKELLHQNKIQYYDDPEFPRSLMMELAKEVGYV